MDTTCQVQTKCALTFRIVAHAYSPIETTTKSRNNKKFFSFLCCLISDKQLFKITNIIILSHMLDGGCYINDHKQQ